MITCDLYKLLMMCIKTEKYISLNFLPEVFQHFHANSVEFMRAPYYSWPQVCGIFLVTFERDLTICGLSACLVG